MIALISKFSPSAPKPVKNTEGGGLISTIGWSSAISVRICVTLRVSLP